MKTILILSVISFAILACGDSGDKSSPIIHHVVTPEPVKEEDDFPEVPEGYPADLKPVWLEDYFDEDRFADHVIMGRVLIELWNQGERGFVNVVGDGIPVRKVYPLYPDVVYVQWGDHDEPGPDGEPLKYISLALGTRDAVRFTSSVNRTDEFKHLTEAEMVEMMAGEGPYMAQYPGLKLVDYSKAGYKPKDVLVDYCNQPGNRARVPYCR